MTLIQKILVVAEYWRAARGHSTTARLATIVVNDGKALARLEERGNATLATADKFRTFLADPANWPDGIPAEAQAVLDRIGPITTPVPLA
jgi:hypothetical protein